MDTHQFQICRRCGQCCSKGGPALHGPDTACFGEDGLALEDLLTLRNGERVHDQPTDTIKKLDGELVKIREGNEGQGCRFYRAKDKSCAIYPRRPAECRALECSAPEALKEMYETDRLGRRDLLPENHPLLELMDAHDERCAIPRLEELAREVLETGDEKAVRAIGEMITYDEELRAQVMDKGGLSEGATYFLFGRPLAVVVTGMGLRAERSDKGLTLSKNPLSRKD